MKNYIAIAVLIISFALPVAFAQNDLAPENIRGIVVNLEFTNGSGIFEGATGFLSFEPAITGNRYQLIDLATWVATSGTYTYEKTGPNTARMTYFDSEAGFLATDFIVFSSETEAVFSLGNAFGSLTGILTLIFPEPIFNGAALGAYPGWRSSPWYMNYNVDFWPWIYHDEHGWQFVSDGSTTDAIFVWDLGLGQWLFLNENTYRWIFMFGENGGWLFTFENNTPSNRFLQRFDDGNIFRISTGS